MNRKLFNLFISCVVILMALCVASSFYNQEQSVLLTYDETTVTKIERWEIESDEIKGEIKLAGFDPADTNFEPYSITNTISTLEYNKPVIMVESMHQAFTVSVGSTIVYEFGNDNSTIFSKPVGGIWHIIELPYIQEDNTIRFDIIPSNDKTSIGITEIFMAEESEATLFLIFRNAVKLLVSLIILAIGVILLVAHFFVSRGLKNNNLILYLGLLSINIAIWLISEGNLLQFTFANAFIVGNLPYWSIQLLLIPFIFYVDSMYTPSHKSISKYFSIAFIVNFVVSAVLNMTGIAYYYNTLWIVHIIMVVTFLYYICSLIYETVAKKNRDAKVLLLQILCLIVAALAELAVFYFGNNMNSVGVSLQTGMLVYLLTCIVSTSLKLRSIWVEGMHTEYLSKIAYTDILTSLFNRNAFERDLEGFKNSNDSDKIIITFDLNNLKYFNDNIGHQTGDNYLRFFAEVAQGILGEYGSCYRIGGDEFSAILYNIPFELVEKNSYIIQEKVKTFDDSGIAGVAVGYAHYDKKEYPNIMDYLHHLDECMFENKTIIKRNI